MNDINLLVPTVKSLLIATASAAVLASTLLITAVLSADYGIDPTGLGKIMGLTALSSVQTKAISQPLATTCPTLPQQVAETSSQVQKQAVKPAAGSTETTQKQPQPSGRIRSKYWCPPVRVWNTNSIW